MKNNLKKKISKSIFTVILALISATGFSAEKNINLKDMGSFTVGGKVYQEKDGSTFHGDHAYVQYFIPVHARKYPLIMWHGAEESGKTWETTPDGRDGYMQIFTRRNWPVYIIDQPGRGRAGRSKLKFMSSDAIPATAGEMGAWNAFRLGEWTPEKGRTFFENTKFPKDEKSVDQFMRWQVGDSGEEVSEFVDNSNDIVNSVSELFKKSGPAVLITHSASGILGWKTAMKNPNSVKAVVAYEPGTYVFPEGERPADISSKNELVSKFSEPNMIPKEEFEKLTKMPILIVYGDNIYESPIFGIEFWRLSLERGKQFVDAINRHGGDAKLVHLPEIGIKGNTHFPFSDLNNVQIANQLSQFLKEKKLD